MAVRVKLLKQVLSLAKQGCSDQVCIQAILESCKSYDAPDTIAAYFAEQRKYLLHRYDMLEAEYMGHLEICSRQKSPQVSASDLHKFLTQHEHTIVDSDDDYIRGIESSYFTEIAEELSALLRKEPGTS